MAPARQSGKPQAIERKPVVSVRSASVKRRRVSKLTADERRRIIWLFSHSNGDADYAADRCEVIGIQRADVLAVVLAFVLAELRRLGPTGAGAGMFAACLGAAA